MSVTPQPARVQMLELAEKYLMEKGPAGFESKELAKRGWFNASQVNYYFGSKSGLIAEAANSLFTSHIGSIISGVENETDPHVGLQVWCDQVISFNTANGATAALVAYPDLFLPEIGSANSVRYSREVLDASERVGTVFFSILYAIARGKKYRRLNRTRVAMVAIAMPRLTNAVVMIGMAAAGLAQVWEQHKHEPIFGFDPRKAFLKGVQQIVKDLNKEPLPYIDEEVIFAD